MESVHSRSYREPNDTVTIDHAVLITIARAAALNIEGVVRLGSVPNTLERVLGRSYTAEGLYLTVEGESVTVEVFLIVDARHNLRQVSLKVQEDINRTMLQYVGMKVQAVNVHIEDVLFEHEG
ncbi:MAG: Asp23/Gls24 family envelope stress response protein [Anaerolineae bacterium]|nr:Asp23/Gls24 family envelope stress response protein [Anaerolineae bacterium]